MKRNASGPIALLTILRICIFAVQAAAANPAVVYSLDEALDRAVDVSPEYRFARRETELGAERFLRERRRFFPTLSLSYAADTAVTPRSPDSRSRRLSAGVRQTVFDGGALRRARRQQEAQLNLRRGEVARIRHEVRSEAWDAVVSYQLAGERVSALESADEAAKNALLIAERQFDIGRITRRALNEARLSAVEIAEELREDRIAFEQARFELAGLLRHPPDSTFMISQGFSVETPPPEIQHSDSQLFEMAVRNNPEFRRQELDLFRAREEAQAAERRYAPEIAATFNISLAAETLPLRDPDVAVGIEVSWAGDTPRSASVAAGTASDGRVRRGAQLEAQPAKELTAGLDRATARLQLERRHTSVDEFEQQLRFAIARERSLFELSVDRWKTAGHRRDLAVLQVEIVEAEAELGLARAIDVLEAVNSRLHAEFLLSQSAFDAARRRRSVEDLVGVYGGALQQ